MTRECPACGRSIGNDEYFCNGCGEALFDSGLSDRGGSRAEHTSDSTPRSVASVRTEADSPPNIADTEIGHSPVYPAAPLKSSKKIPWRFIKAAIAVVAIVAVALSIYFIYRSPEIRVSPPPGWTQASMAERDAKERLVHEDSPDMDLIDMYLEGGNDNDRILIMCKGGDLNEEPPETKEIAEMERFIEGLGQTFSPDEMKYLEDIHAVMLGCGLAGQYQATEGGSLDYEVLSVRKKNRVFVILYYTKGPMGQIPSPEMQHFIDTVSFN